MWGPKPTLSFFCLFTSQSLFPGNDDSFVMYGVVIVFLDSLIYLIYIIIIIFISYIKDR